jgi:hypothetical protein
MVSPEPFLGVSEFFEVDNFKIPNYFSPPYNSFV